jgi:hypothetical protein
VQSHESRQSLPWVIFDVARKNMLAIALLLFGVVLALGWIVMLVRISPAPMRKISVGMICVAACATLVWALSWAGENRSSYYASAVPSVAFLMGVAAWTIAASILWALLHVGVAVAKRSEEYLEPGIYGFCILAIAAGIALKNLIH